MSSLRRGDENNGHHYQKHQCNSGCTDLSESSAPTQGKQCRNYSYDESAEYRYQYQPAAPNTRSSSAATRRRSSASCSNEARRTSMVSVSDPSYYEYGDTFHYTSSDYPNYHCSSPAHPLFGSTYNAPPECPEEWRNDRIVRRRSSESVERKLSFLGAESSGDTRSSFEKSWDCRQHDRDGMIKQAALLPLVKQESFLQDQKKAPSSMDKKSIEVFPGECMRLRGADETWRAIQVDFYTPCQCVCCSSTIFCIQDASFVLCPECRVISPLLSTDGLLHDNGNKNSGSRTNGGVGLGFTMQDLARSQEELARKRKELKY